MDNIQKALKALYKTVPGKRRSCAVRAKGVREARAAMTSYHWAGGKAQDTKHCFSSHRQFRDMNSRLADYTDWLELEYRPCVKGFEVNAMIAMADEALVRDCGDGLAGRRIRRKVRR